MDDGPRVLLGAGRDPWTMARPLCVPSSNLKFQGYPSSSQGGDYSVDDVKSVHEASAAICESQQLKVSMGDL